VFAVVWIGCSAVPGMKRHPLTIRLQADLERELQQSPAARPRAGGGESVLTDQ
jgi:hypothetical protein